MTKPLNQLLPPPKNDFEWLNHLFKPWLDFYLCYVNFIQIYIILIQFGMIWHIWKSKI